MSQHYLNTNPNHQCHNAGGSKSSGLSQAARPAGSSYKACSCGSIICHKESIPRSNVLKYIQICHTKQTNTTTCWSFTNFNEQIECYAHLSRQPSSVHVPRLLMVSIAKEPALVQSRVSFSLSLSRNLPRRCEQLQWPRPKNTWKLFWWR